MSDLITISEVCELTGLSRNTISRHRTGRTRTPFPPPIRTHPLMFQRNDVEQWMQHRATLPTPLK